MKDLRNSSSPLAVDVVTNGRDYVRAKIVDPPKPHTLSWYQKVPGREWERKTRPLTAEEAVAMQKVFQSSIRSGGGPTPDEFSTIMGIERGTDVQIMQLTLTRDV